MTITAEKVKALRDQTGAGFMECKAALVEAGGDLEKATLILRTRGQAAAARKAGRATAEGLIGSYIHLGGKLGVLVEVNCETDFVARTEAFQTLVKELAMQIAATDPAYIRREDVPPEVIEQEKAIYRAQIADATKPPAVVDRIVEGKLAAFFAEKVLLEQPSIRDPKVTVGQLIAEAVARLGENITVARFARFRVGEGRT